MELEELIKSVDIVEYISQYVDLEQKGDEFWGLSCFKDEKTPSFSVRQDPPVFYDYSSGIGGNVYTFVKHYNKCSGKEAVDILKKYSGFSGDVVNSREKMSATMVCKQYAKPKQNIKTSRSTVFPPDYMKRYEKNEEKYKIWMDEGISKDSLERFEVMYDGFSNRLVYPVKNTDGDIVNIGGRTLDPEWKEKKQRKYCYFYPWGVLDTIYGFSDNLQYIKGAGEIILFEGCKSVLIADTWGIKNTGAVLTSHLNPQQLMILASLGCRVVFALDKDVNILSDFNIKKLKRYVNVSYIFDTENLLDEKDSPVDKGREVFEILYQKRRRYR